MCVDFQSNFIVKYHKLIKEYPKNIGLSLK